MPLKRKLYPIPDDVLQTLKNKKLWDAYGARPSYQQNDYIGWITRAKLPATREKRLAQMLDELERSDVYMKMTYNPKKIDRCRLGIFVLFHVIFVVASLKL